LIRALAAAALLLLSGMALAQVPAASGNVNASGTVTNGQCATFTGTGPYNVIGGACGNSISLTGGTGIDVSPNPITGTGTITLDPIALTAASDPTVTGQCATAAGTSSNAVTWAACGGSALLASNNTWTGTNTFNNTVSGTGITSLFASPPAIGGTAPAAIAATTISASGQITSTLSVGTAPFVITSTTNVPNLNASSLSGATFAAPGPIGSTTASTGAFTTLSATSTVSGAGFTSLFASPPAIGGTAAAAGTFTTLVATTNGAITGTSLPTQASGTLGLGGISTTPTFGASGEGDMWLSSTLGLVMGGDGSTNDITILNSAGGTVWAVGHNTLTNSFGGEVKAAQLQVAGGVASIQSGTVQIAAENGTAPTLSNNGEGVVYLLSTTGGLTLMGKGSTSDFTGQNDAGTTWLSIPTGTTNFVIPGAVGIGGSAVETSGIDSPAYWAAGTQGLASKTCTINTTNVAAGITITITQGLITATTGC
jgi:hypothetical protein